MSISSIIVAAGSGTRLGSPTPKAFVPLGDRPMLCHSLDVFATHPHIASLVLVVPQSQLLQAREVTSSCNSTIPLSVVSGGPQRWESARNGALACPDTTEWVLIHDAARPFVTHAVIDNLLAIRDRFACAFTATPEVDTIRYFDGNRASSTVDRSRLVRVGTPQLFHLPTLLDAFREAENFAVPPTDEVMLFEKRGLPVGISWGDPLNFKITTPADLEIAEALIERRRQMLLGR